jgi:hypothetical protein
MDCLPLFALSDRKCAYLRQENFSVKIDLQLFRLFIAVIPIDYLLSALRAHLDSFRQKTASLVHRNAGQIYVPGRNLCSVVDALRLNRFYFPRHAMLGNNIARPEGEQAVGIELRLVWCSLSGINENDVFRTSLAHLTPIDLSR